MLSCCNCKCKTSTKERNRKRERSSRKFNTKNDLEIVSWTTKPEERETKKKDKKSWIPFWSKESRKRNKRPSLCNSKEKFKELNISNALKKKTRLTNRSLFSVLTKKNKGILRPNKTTADCWTSKKKPAKKNCKEENRKLSSSSISKMIQWLRNKRK